MNINAVEALWIAVNLIAVVMSAASLADAVTTYRAARALDEAPSARRVASGNSVRRETVRLVIQFLLLSLVLPGLGIPGEVPLNVFTMTLIGISALLLAQTLLDLFERRALSQFSIEQLLTERQRHDAEMLRLMATLTEHANAAFTEANNTNAKIVRLNERLVEHDDKAATIIADLDTKVDEHKVEAVAEIERTDAHQEVQDGQIADQDERLTGLE